MLCIDAQQYRALEAAHEDRLGVRFRREFAAIQPRSPVLGEDRWPAWWRETIEQGRAYGVEDTHQLSVHALMRFLYGPEYLKHPDLAWLAEALAPEAGDPPDYRELTGFMPQVLDVIDAMHAPEA